MSAAAALSALNDYLFDSYVYKADLASTGAAMASAITITVGTNTVIDTLKLDGLTLTGRSLTRSADLAELASSPAVNVSASNTSVDTAGSVNLSGATLSAYDGNFITLTAGESITFTFAEAFSTEGKYLYFGHALQGGIALWSVENPYQVTVTGPLTGTPAPDVLTGSKGHDTISGGGDRDILTGGLGNDRIDGGDGVDTAVYSGNRSQYSVVDGPWTMTITDLNGSEGSDDLTSIERLQFQDGTLAFDVDGIAGQAYRLYQAAFARTPDAGGLGYWIDLLDEGQATLPAAASAFIASAEFRATYGTSVPDAALLNLLYRNVLGRDADAGGNDYWMEQMAAGMSRESLLINFSESAENKALTAAAVDDGIWFV